MRHICRFCGEILDFDVDDDVMLSHLLECHMSLIVALMRGLWESADDQPAGME